MILSHSSRAGSTFQTVPPNESSQGAFSSTAFIKASETSTDRLNIRNLPGSRLASMKASMSGWVASQGRHSSRAPVAGAHNRPAHRVPDIHKAQRPRRVGAHPLDRAPRGRKVEKS